MFEKSGAKLSVSVNTRQLARVAVDLHWALKAVAAATPGWSEGFPSGDASDKVIADWRTIQDSERIDDGEPDDAVLAAAARLLTALPSVSLGWALHGEAGR